MSGKAKEKVEKSVALKAFVDEVVALCRKYDAQINGTDDFGLEVIVGKEKAGGDFDTLFYQITDEGIV